MNRLGYHEVRPGRVRRSHGGAPDHVMVQKGIDARSPDTVQVDGRTFRKVNYSSGSGQMYVEQTDFGGYRRR